jgi:hypothetical protein
MSGKRLNRSKSKSDSRRRNKRRLKNKKQTNLTAQPVLAAQPVPAPVPEFVVMDRKGDCNGPLGPCPICLNTGAYSAVKTPDAPMLVSYCTCIYGTERLANILDIILGLQVQERDRIIIQELYGMSAAPPGTG